MLADKLGIDAANLSVWKREGAVPDYHLGRLANWVSLSVFEFAEITT